MTWVDIYFYLLLDCFDKTLTRLWHSLSSAAAFRSGSRIGSLLSTNVTISCQRCLSASLSGSSGHTGWQLCISAAELSFPGTYFVSKLYPWRFSRYFRILGFCMSGSSLLKSLTILLQSECTLNVGIPAK